MVTGNNDRLKARRELLGLTQAEVAHLACEYIVAATGRPIGIDADYVSRLERGQIRRPRPLTREALRSVLRAASDAELGLARQPNGFQGMTLPTDLLLPLAEQATLGRLDTGNLVLLDTANVQRIRSGDVADFCANVDWWEHADHRRGGMSLFRRTVLGQVTEAVQALSAASFESDSVRRDWMSAISRAARLAAFSSFDAREYDTATRAFLLAQQTAAAADDWPARINILCGMARQAIYTGHPDHAFRLVSMARTGEDSSSATTRAMLGSVRARTFAALGQSAGAVRAIKEAEDAFADRDQSADPPFLWYYDEAQVSGDTGHALYTLAEDDERFVEDAIDHLSRAVDLHDPAVASRSRSFSLCKLIALELRWNGPGPDALIRVADAIESVSQVQSGRAFDGLMDVGRLLSSHDSEDARQLAARIAAVCHA